MKMISAVLAVLFSLSVTLTAVGPAFAFDPTVESKAQLYFSIPFGGATKEQSTPRFGFSVDYGMPQSVTGDVSMIYRPSNLDFRYNISGDASVYSNGFNLSEQLKALKASDDEDWVEGWVTPLGAIGIGIGIFMAAKAVN